MLKNILLILLLMLFSLSACSYKTDIKPDIYSDSVKQDYKNDREELNEQIQGMDYDEVINKFKNILPGEYSVIMFKYFVVFSYLDNELTNSLIDNDIRQASDCMMNIYVKNYPSVLTPVIIFGDENNYKKFVLDNYDIPESDISPFGFYKISKNVIVIRYVSWKGSVKHEITHRFLKSDFQDIPSWFDEGFASLHEKSSFKNGELIGEFSWRIIPLRRAINEGTYTGLRKMMESNDEELYGRRSSYYYAQARYLLMYLQEMELLKDYYILFKDTFKKDESGIAQLEKVLNKTLDEIDYDYINYLKSFKN